MSCRQCEGLGFDMCPIQSLDHGGQGGRQHVDCDNYLLAPMLVRKEGVVAGGRRGRGDEMMKGGNRISRMARYCWDGKDGGSGHSLMGFFTNK